MKKLKLIIEREFIAKVRNKSFIMMTFLSPVLVILMGALVFYLMKKNDEEIKKIAYVDDSGLFSKQDFIDSKTIKYINYTKLGFEETKKKTQEEHFYGTFYIPKNDSLEVLAKSIKFFSKDSPNVEIITAIESKINSRLKNLKLARFNINLDKIEASKIKTDIKLFDFSGEKSSKLSSVLKMAFGTIAGYLLMMFVMIYGSSVMRSVIEEKTSRIIEVIVSSVKPFELMLGKIIGNASAGILQFLIWGVLILIFSIVASTVFGINHSEIQASSIQPEQLKMAEQIQSTGKFQNLIIEIAQLPWVSMFFLFIFYFISGYMLYSSLFAAIGAAVDNETDTQQFMMPIMLPLVLAVYVGLSTVIKAPHGPIAVIFSYIPLTSPIVMLMRYPFGVEWWEIVISMSLLTLSFIGVVWLAAKIYRVGILSYGKKPTYKDLIKWIKYKG